MSSNQVPLERLSTGSAALDRILGGGLPIRSTTVVAGEPGAGKSLFALQMLFHLARQGKKGLYFTTLSEPSLKLIRRITLGLTSRAVPYTNEGMALRGNRLLLLPEDSPSRLFEFRLPVSGQPAP